MTDKDGYKTVDVREVYSGSLLKLNRETVKPPGGPEHVREVVRGVRASTIVGITDLGEVVLVRQYRQPVRGMVLELPAGLVNAGESPRETAAREFKEETGYDARNFEHLVDFYTTPGYSDEVLSLFLATGLSEGEASPDFDEALEVLKIPYEQAVKMIEGGDIRDGKTIIGILLAEGAARSRR